MERAQAVPDLSLSISSLERETGASTVEAAALFTDLAASDLRQLCSRAAAQHRYDNLIEVMRFRVRKTMTTQIISAGYCFPISSWRSVHTVGRPWNKNMLQKCSGEHKR
ncbi:unnamed protein product [Urochloa humidicola]